MDVFAVLGRSCAPHPGAASTYTALGDTLGCNPGTTAALHGASLRLGHGVKVKVGTPLGYPLTGLEITKFPKPKTAPPNPPERSNGPQWTPVDDLRGGF